MSTSTFENTHKSTFDSIRMTAFKSLKNLEYKITLFCLLIILIISTINIIYFLNS